MSSPQLIQWIVDTRPLWPVPKGSPKEEMASFQKVASKPLSFLPPTGRGSVLRYYHVKDAKLSLTSHLLKHLVVTKYAHVPWSQSVISRDEKGKPYFSCRSGEVEEFHVEFNVSHQAGIVSLIAAVGRHGVNVGTDVVCVNERMANDYRHIDAEGFFTWVDIHGDVFAESEISFMKCGQIDDLEIDGLDTTHGFNLDKLARCQWRNQTIELQNGDERMKVQSNHVIDAKLRRFYAMWCLRETYVKMTGDALLASWLKELEISEVKVPASKPGLLKPESLEPGGIVKTFRMFFKGRLVTNVAMELIAIGSNFMVGGAVSIQSGAEISGLELGTWRELDIENVILDFAEPFP
ncbi:hypothetical protein BJ878DRAFT_282324 [Calycina marina]|uniref:holo-[acyl-carrier-protein] synthase n=1 Tax=Calycina marina TaxID=1763456 RepID=A0A9P7YVP4_9HELO|nr:hypothetical protein BJ878DRAFT_282324 [Calycina marina]